MTVRWIGHTLTLLAALLFLTGCPSGDTEPEDDRDPNPSGMCFETNDCPIGQVCQEGLCGLARECQVDGECPGGQQCIEGGCYVINPPNPDPNPDPNPIPMPNPEPNPPNPDPTPNPDPDVCDGCFQNETCLPGTFDEACGGGGAACVACQNGQVCDEGLCVEDVSCTADNCDGCCLGDRCLGGTTVSACGSGGFQCQECNPGAACDNGNCIDPCGPDNCGGCCDEDGDCNTFGDSDFACGSGGDQCDTCDGDQRCSDGICIDLGCSETCNGCCSGQTCLAGSASNACGQSGNACIDCGPGRLCEFSECTVDPRSRWDVLVLSADVSDTDTNDDSWDSFGGLPDPYIMLMTSDSGSEFEERSETRDNTTAPFWFEDVLINVPAEALMNRMDILLYDDDNFGDTIMGSCFFRFTDGNFTGDTVELTCPENTNNNRIEFTLRLQLNRH